MFQISFVFYFSGIYAYNTYCASLLGFAVTLLFGKTNSEKYLERCEHSFLPASATGVPKALEEIKRENGSIKIDRRLTGSNIIDEPLQQVLQFALRDYIQYWYYTLSDDESFLLEVRQTIQNALIEFAIRSKEVDWQPYFTTRLVDGFATHLHVFRKAQPRTEDSRQKKDTSEELIETFFEVEVEMEKDVCRDLICTSTKDEEAFLRDLCEVLLYLLLPPGDFHNKNMRYFLREILAKGILLPLINQFSDPDYINQYIIWMIRDTNCNYEAFMNVIKLSDKVAELEAVRDKAAEELQYLRSLDTVGDDYMQQTGGQAHLFFWLTVEGYRVTAQQQLEVLRSPQRDGKRQNNQTKGLLHVAAVGVYEQYLSEKASPRVHVDDNLVAKLAEKLNHEDPTPEIFDDIQRKVYDMMLKEERFYPSFRQNLLYVRMLAELDMLKDPSIRGSDDGDLGISEDSLQLQAYISDTGVCNDHGKTYALYAITVTRRNPDGIEDMWKTYRRYSDFHDFHMRITEQFENVSSLKLPGKKTFNNMDKDFLERRKKDLNAYLQLLLNPETIKGCPALVPYVNDFLENKAYSKGKGDFARKMDTLVNPLRNSMRNVSNAVKSFPDSLAEGMTKVSDNMGKMSDKLGHELKHSILKVPPLKPEEDFEHIRVSVLLDDNVDDNIPLKVMLLLMDEVFDLKERNHWLRRNIKNLLQQLIRATYGDTINRKIVDHVDWMTSPEQVAETVKRFRDSFWPNSILAETPPLREKEIRMRTRVAAKTKMLVIMPDELKHIIGAETARKGILRVFEMFQHNQLNRRLVHVFLEGFLETLFPQYKFHELFIKLHSRSERIQKYKQKFPSAQVPSSQKR
uniref:Sorting nexin 13 n=1 Tax=Callorhinchus milii TaxID=7868 RepID=A0A4W3HDZ7_CALMI